MKRILLAGLCLLPLHAWAQMAYAPHLPTAVEFTGGPVATLGSLTGGSGYVDGTYTNVALTGGSCSGVTGNITVSGGAVTSVVLTNGGAAITASGAVGCLTTDILTASTASIGGGAGSGFSIPVATIGSFSWTVPSQVSLVFLDGAAGGGGGGAGQATSGAGGGGGGGGEALLNFPASVTPGNAIIITIPSGGTGGIVGGAAAGNGGSLTLSGIVTGMRNPALVGGNAGNAGAAGTGGTGGTGGTANSGGTAGGAAGVGGTAATQRDPIHCGGTGGGGGGNTAGNPANGGAGLYFTPGGSFTGNGNGGGGGASCWGQGGVGGNATPGGTPTIGHGGGGGGGAVNTAGAAGSPGWFRIRY